jgi:hypothetical protein
VLLQVPGWWAIPFDASSEAGRALLYYSVYGADKPQQGAAVILQQSMP